MSKQINDDFDFIDDYFEEDDELLHSQYSPDLSNVSYADFNKVNEVFDDDDYDDYVDEEPVSTRKKSVNNITSLEKKIMEKEELMDFLSVFSIWFRRIGVIGAIILIVYFLVNGLFRDLFLYIILLVVAFCLGFGIMAIINKVMEYK